MGEYPIIDELGPALFVDAPSGKIFAQTTTTRKEGTISRIDLSFLFTLGQNIFEVTIKLFTVFPHIVSAETILF